MADHVLPLRHAELPSVVQIARSLLRWAKRVAVFALLAGALGYVGLIVLHYQPLVIVTGSMQKTIPVGSLVVDRSVDPEVLRVGDVISFEKPLGAHGIDTHRIVAIKDEHGGRLFQTKGDSNPIVDPWLIRFDRGMTAHRMAFSVPYVGNALLVARSPAVRMALVAFASLVVLLSLLKAIATGVPGSREPQASTVEAAAVAPPPTPAGPAAPVALAVPKDAPRTPGRTCASTHHWEVAYHRGHCGDDAIWRFPHRCRDCATELLARNVVDATALCAPQGA
jgi:signal peptidase